MLLVFVAEKPCNSCRGLKRDLHLDELLLMGKKIYIFEGCLTLRTTILWQLSPQRSHGCFNK